MIDLVSKFVVPLLVAWFTAWVTVQLNGRWKRRHDFRCAYPQWVFAGELDVELWGYPKPLDVMVCGLDVMSGGETHNPNPFPIVIHGQGVQCIRKAKRKSTKAHLIYEEPKLRFPAVFMEKEVKDWKVKVRIIEEDFRPGEQYTITVLADTAWLSGLNAFGHGVSSHHAMRKLVPLTQFYVYVPCMSSPKNPGSGSSIRTVQTGTYRRNVDLGCIDRGCAALIRKHGSKGVPRQELPCLNECE